AFGADAVVRVEAPRDDDADLGQRNAWVTLGTLGLYAPRVQPTQDRWRSLGAYDAKVEEHPSQTSPPFEPMDRLLPADGYWAAKRIVAVPAAVIDAALDAARLSDASARARLRELILARRLAVAARAFAAVTPCEVDRVEGGRVVLRDE